MKWFFSFFLKNSENIIIYVYVLDFHSYVIIERRKIWEQNNYVRRGMIRIISLWLKWENVLDCFLFLHEIQSFSCVCECFSMTFDLFHFLAHLLLVNNSQSSTSHECQVIIHILMWFMIRPYVFHSE